MPSFLDVSKSAIISPDKLYRYVLHRVWDTRAPTLCWVMLNPSTADATDDDATIRRCMGFAHGFGYGGMVVVNLFAYRATMQRDLRRRAQSQGLNHIVGPHNDYHLVNEALSSNDVLIAWGTGGGLLGRDAEVLKLLDNNRIRYHCLGHTNERQPKHPLRLSGRTPFQDYVPLWPTSGTEKRPSAGTVPLAPVSP